jgi:hypothetical protein
MGSKNKRNELSKANKDEDAPKTSDQIDEIIKQTTFERVTSDLAWILSSLVIIYFAELPQALQENAYGLSLYAAVLYLSRLTINFIVPSLDSPVWEHILWSMYRLYRRRR